jgi:hypothetical protein
MAKRRTKKTNPYLSRPLWDEVKIDAPRPAPAATANAA